MAIMQGTWGNLLGPLSNIDFGLTEKYAPFLGTNPNQPGQSMEFPVNVQDGKIQPIENPFKTTAPAPSPAVKIAPGAQVPTSTAQVPTSTSGGPDLSQQINAMYGPAFAALSDIEASQAGLQQTAISGLENQKSAIQEAYDLANKKTQTLLGNQGEDLFTSQRRAEGKALRDYLAAEQRGNATFGRSSSAGGAISEIILGEFLRTGGDLRASYASGQKLILQAQREQEAEFVSKTTQLEKDFRQAVQEVNDNFTQRILEIGLKKAALEQEKTAMRIDALNRAVDDARTLTAYKEKALFDLGTWNIQRKAELGQTQTYLDDLTAKVAAEMQARKAEMQNATTDNLLTVAPGQVNTLFKKPGTEEDPFKNLLSPR